MNQPHALLIDDNTQNLRVLAQLLAKQGVSSTEISNPKVLEQTLPTLEQVSVVFLDLELPGLDSFDLKDLLKSYFGDIPIIAYTVHVSEINVVRQVGFDGFLGKPLDSSRFPDQLVRILNREPVWERA
jgi:CheY-like chemotaxis protein